MTKNLKILLSSVAVGAVAVGSLVNLNASSDDYKNWEKYKTGKYDYRQDMENFKKYTIMGNYYRDGGLGYQANVNKVLKDMKKDCKMERTLKACFDYDEILYKSANKYEEFYKEVVPKWCFERNYNEACGYAISNRLVNTKPYNYEDIVKVPFFNDELNVKMTEYECKILKNNGACSSLYKAYRDLKNDDETAYKWKELAKEIEQENGKNHIYRKIQEKAEKDFKDNFPKEYLN